MNQTIQCTSQCWVIKIGSSLLTNDGTGISCAIINTWVQQIAQLVKDGKKIVLVSSGAIAEGVSRLGWKHRPHALNELQAAAAVGQMGLVQAYETCFQKSGLRTAQVLLTHDDLSDRKRYLNARSTLRTLLSNGVIPIVNENDTVVTDEIKFGDNDTLAALVANLIEADLLVILTDQKGLFNKDPCQYYDAELVSNASVDDPRLDEMAGDGVGKFGRGGMRTKINAARLAARSGAATVLMAGREKNGLLAINSENIPGTLLSPVHQPIAARKQWLIGQLQLRGKLILDDGAVKVLSHDGKSLLAVGVCAIEGEFKRGDLVSCTDGAGREIARGLINYSAAETSKIMGQPSTNIEQLLGYVDALEIIHRDNLVLV